jgi:hypothetical protein
MTTKYFPIFPPQDPNSPGRDGDPVSPEWPFIENKFENRYSVRMSLGFKRQHYKPKYFLLSSWSKYKLAQAWRQGDYIVGDYVAPGNGHVYMCAVAGTTGGSQPSWSTTHEGSQSDGGVTWICFPDNQVQAVKEFIDNRYGHVVSFYVWIPEDQVWTLMVFPPEPFDVTPISGGSEHATVEIPFVQEY